MQVLKDEMTDLMDQLTKESKTRYLSYMVDIQVPESLIDYQYFIQNLNYGKCKHENPNSGEGKLIQSILLHLEGVYETLINFVLLVQTSSGGQL